MPAQVVAAVRARNKGTPDEDLRGEFYRAHKDMFFLYEIHEQLNRQAIQEQEVRQLKVQILGDKLKALINHFHFCNIARLKGFKFPDDLSTPLPERTKPKDELSLDEEILAWPREEMLLWGEVMSFTEATRILSEHYFGGEDLLYPNVRQELASTLVLLAGWREVYEETLDMRPPESDKEFILWMARNEDEKCREASADDAADDMPRPRVKRVARALAEHVVLMARAEALDDLGERGAGIKLRTGCAQSRGSRHWRMREAEMPLPRSRHVWACFVCAGGRAVSPRRPGQSRWSTNPDRGSSVSLCPGRSSRLRGYSFWGLDHKSLSSVWSTLAS
jgi:hypothetical protein